MRRIPPDAVHCLDPLFQSAYLQMPLPGPGAGKLQPLVFTVQQIKTQTHGPGQMHRLLALVLKFRAAGENPSFCKNRIEKREHDTGQRILKLHGQSLCFPRILRIGRRKSRKLWLSLQDLMASVYKIRYGAPVLLQDRHCRMPEICSSVYAVFLSGMLQRKGIVIVVHIRRHGTVHPLLQIRKIFFMMNSLSKIQLSKMAVRQYGHNVAHLFIIQMKCLCSLTK